MRHSALQTAAADGALPPAGMGTPQPQALHSPSTAGPAPVPWKAFALHPVHCWAGPTCDGLRGEGRGVGVGPIGEGVSAALHRLNIGEGRGLGHSPQMDLQGGKAGRRGACVCLCVCVEGGPLGSAEGLMEGWCRPANLPASNAACQLPAVSWMLGGRIAERSCCRGGNRVVPPYLSGLALHLVRAHQPGAATEHDALHVTLRHLSRLGPQHVRVNSNRQQGGLAPCRQRRRQLVLAAGDVGGRAGQGGCGRPWQLGGAAFGRDLPRTRQCELGQG